MTASAPKTRRRTAKPVGEMRSDFEFCDRNRDGRIDRREFAEFMLGLGAELSAEELKIGFGEIDADGDERISWPEFRAWWGED